MLQTLFSLAESLLFDAPITPLNHEQPPVLPLKQRLHGMPSPVCVTSRCSCRKPLSCLLSDPTCSRYAAGEAVQTLYKHVCVGVCVSADAVYFSGD